MAQPLDSFFDFSIKRNRTNSGSEEGTFLIEFEGNFPGKEGRWVGKEVQDLVIEPGYCIHSLISTPKHFNFPFSI